MRNKSGKTLTIFLILIAIILVSSTAIAVFLLLKQAQLREAAELSLTQLETSESGLRAELGEIKKQKDLLEKKTQEAEAKIESLLEDLDLAEGVRDEVKKENRELKDSMEALKKSSDEIKAQLVKKEEEAGQRVVELQDQLNAALERNKTLEEKRQELEKEYETLKQKLSSYDTLGAGDNNTAGIAADANVNLEKIVVNAGDANQGRVVSVDGEAEFVIVNLGERSGVVIDALLSIYEGDKYIGDVKVTKVLPEMCAADFVRPLTSQEISEGDLAILKQ